LGGHSSSSHAGGSQAGSVSGHSHSALAQPAARLSAMMPGATNASAVSLNDPEKGLEEKKTKTKRTWYGRKRTIVVDPNEPEERPARLFAPLYNGLAAGLSAGTDRACQ
jgi:hypothetical protein